MFTKSKKSCTTTMRIIEMKSLMIGLAALAVAAMATMVGLATLAILEASPSDVRVAGKLVASIPVGQRLSGVDYTVYPSNSWIMLRFDNKNVGK